MKYALMVRSPESLKDQIFDLDGDRITVGRGGDNDITFAIRTLSRHHFALIAAEDGGYFIVDNGSMGGTYVNCMPIHSKHRLVVGDIISSGPFHLEYITR